MAIIGKTLSFEKRRLWPVMFLGCKLLVMLRVISVDAAADFMISKGGRFTLK